MKFSNQYPIWITLILFFTVSCGESGADLSPQAMQATIDAAVQATTEGASGSSQAAVDAPQPAAEPTQAIAASESESAAPPATPTPIPTDTPVPPPTDTPVPAATATPDLPLVRTDLGDGNVRYDLPFDGFSLSLPSDWVVADFYGVSDSPDQAKMEELLGSKLFQNLVAVGVKFYAVNLSEASLAAINPASVNVSTFSAEGAPLLEEFGAVAIDQLNYQFGIAPEAVGQSAVTMGALPAIRLEYTEALANPTGDQLNLQHVRYITVQNGLFYNVTITIPVELAPSLLPAVESAVQGIEFR